jgi:nitric oxide reductase NorQ protein
VQLATALRRLTDHDLEETASTRLLVSAGRLVASGLSMQLACEAAVIDALTDDLETALALRDVAQAMFGDAT